MDGLYYLLRLANVMEPHPSIRAASAFQVARVAPSLMPRLSPWMILTGTLAAFAFSFAYYSIPPLAEVFERLGPQGTNEVTAAMVAIELLRTMLLVTGISWFVAVLRARWRGAMIVSAIAWITFVATQWLGSVMWNDEPIDLAMLHAGDWLGKMLLVAVIAGAWRPRRSSKEGGLRRGA